MSILDHAKELGHLQSQGRTVLPNLAMGAARAAAAGEIDETDAEDIYAEYAKYAWRVTKFDTKGVNARAQISKLRQIIKLAEAGGVPLLLKVTRLHRDASMKAKVIPLYDSMVAAARAQLGRTSPLTDKQIVQLMQYKSRR